MNSGDPNYPSIQDYMVSKVFFIHKQLDKVKILISFPINYCNFFLLKLYLDFFLNLVTILQKAAILGDENEVSVLKLNFSHVTKTILYCW